MTTITKARQGRRWARRVLPVMMATTAALGLSTLPAHANENVFVQASNGCSSGLFKPYGEHFYLWDDCGDGHSAVLRVDVAPTHSGNGYDYRLWNYNGSNTGAKHWDKSYAEGKEVCIQAGIGNYGSKEDWGFGSRDCISA